MTRNLAALLSHVPQVVMGAQSGMPGIIGSTGWERSALGSARADEIELLISSLADMGLRYRTS